MKEVRPICVMYFPRDFSFDLNGMVFNPLRLMNELNGWGDKHGKGDDIFDDYIWWCFWKDGINEPELKVLNSNDFNTDDIEELKQQVYNHCKIETE